MGLRDELRNVPSGTTCAVGKLLERLDAAVADELMELIDDPSVQSSALARLAKTKDWGVREHSFSRHRRKDCACR